MLAKLRQINEFPINSSPSGRHKKLPQKPNTTILKKNAHVQNNVTKDSKFESSNNAAFQINIQQNISIPK